MQERRTVRILLVDDAASIQNFTSRVLKHLGHGSVETACNGISAFNSINNSSRSFDLIVCNPDQPGMQGALFTKQLVKNGYAGELKLLETEDSSTP